MKRKLEREALAAAKSGGAQAGMRFYMSIANTEFQYKISISPFYSSSSFGHRRSRRRRRATTSFCIRPQWKVLDQNQATGRRPSY
jgi:hypothetical protein